jgi:serine phosphatase RsbU (regulator of sigma subunit)
MPIIMVSGMGGISDALKALKLGAWDYLTKPIEDMAALEHAVKQSLERAHLLRENREYREHLEAVNAQLQRSLKQLQEDEEAGRRIQFQLLPKTDRRYGPYVFSRHLLTSQYLSGDFVDYFAIDAQHLGFYMADVSGHGVSSAFVTVLLRSYINRYLERYWQDNNVEILEPSHMLKHLNEEIIRARLGKYLTMFYGVINCGNNQLSYSNSGQFPFPIIFDGTHATYIEGKSFPVGLFDFADYHTKVLELPSVFALALISDGILEVLSKSNIEKKLNFLLNAVEDVNIDIETLMKKLALSQTNDLPDDISILLITKH